jgi:hypothetical protein
MVEHKIYTPKSQCAMKSQKLPTSKLMVLKKLIIFEISKHKFDTF